MVFAKLFLDILYGRLFPPADPRKSFAGKTILVTGGTSGLGLEAAKKLAALDAFTVIITARNQAKGELAKKEIEEASRKKASDDLDVQVWPLDMSDFDSIKQFVDRVNSELSRLDAAILNAGTITRPYQQVSEKNGSWEMTLMANAIATIFLGLLLLPKLLSTSELKNADPLDPPHLCFVSSTSATALSPAQCESFRSSTSVLEAANEEKSYPGGALQYMFSKLFLEYGMRHMAGLPIVNPFGKTKVIVNTVCPNFCRSNLGNQKAKVGIRELLISFSRFLLARTTEQGSRSYVSGIQVGTDGHGKLWHNDQFIE